jgi:hypothetical protein
MSPRILLVQPPIYDFAAYDFWLRPLGLLRVAGQLRGQAEMTLFDFLDRRHPAAAAGAATGGDAATHSPHRRLDAWGRGEFLTQVVPKPAALAPVPRRFRRLGLPREVFRRFLTDAGGAYDFALVQTTMTYWYPGVREVIEDLRELAPTARIVLGGVYATICPHHARSLGADLVVAGRDLTPLWQLLGLPGQADQPPLWEACDQPRTGAIKLTEGCPLRCTYCSVPLVYGGFTTRPTAQCIGELELMLRQGVRDVAFYDDALLCRPQDALLPFLRQAGERPGRVNFHTPNALHARLVTPALAAAMVGGGFRTFYLGFESVSDAWQGHTGGKVGRDDLAPAVEDLRSAGAAAGDITAYIIIGHPDDDEQAVEESMACANALGVRITLADFSPVPGTPDGERCRQWADIDEPLWHNKTAFAWARLGEPRLQHLKQRCRDLNARLAGGGGEKED